MTEFLEDIKPTVYDKDLGTLYELGARKEEGGVEVRLLWSSLGNTVLLDVLHSTGNEFKAEVPKDKALDSLYHPSLYMPAEEASSFFGRAA